MLPNEACNWYACLAAFDAAAPPTAARCCALLAPRGAEWEEAAATRMPVMPAAASLDPEGAGLVVAPYCNIPAAGVSSDELALDDRPFAGRIPEGWEEWMSCTLNNGATDPPPLGGSDPSLD